MNNTGHYVSIDSRPVSCTRGTLKKIISLYKSYLGCGCLVEGTNVVKDPFLCLNLVCPSTSYDVNVEPAKDDILFVNADSVIGIFECFLKSVYGELRVPPSLSTKSRSPDQRPRGFDVLLATKSQPGSKISKQLVYNAQPANRNGVNATSMLSAGFEPAHTGCDGLPPLTNSNGVSVQSHEEAELDGRNLQIDNSSAVADEVAISNGPFHPVSESSAAKPRQGWQRDMYGVNEDDLDEPYGPQEDGSQLQDSQDSDEEAGLHDASISNPWAIAKLNAPLRRINKEKRAGADMESNNQLLTPRHQAGELGKATARQVHEILRGSNTSNFGLPTPAREMGCQVTSKIPQNPSSPEKYPFADKIWGKSDRKIASSKHTSFPKTRNGCGALDTWVLKPIDSGSVTTRSACPFDDDMQDPNMPVQTPTRNFVSARALPMGTPLSVVPERASKSTRNRSPGKKIRTGRNKPFISPVNEPSRVWLNMEPKGNSISSQPAPAQSVDAVAASNGIRFDREDQDSATGSSPTRSISLVHPDLAAAMDYETRKQAALQHWKVNQRRKAVPKDLVLSSENEPSCSSSKKSPHQNRYSRAVANLHSLDSRAASLEPQPPSFQPGDPRAYLLRTQEDNETTCQGFPNDSSKRSRNRRKTGLLPLETILSDRSTRDLILILDQEELGLKARLQPSRTGGASICDEYINSGTTVGAFSSCTIHQVHAWEARVREMVVTLRRGTGEDDGVAGERTDFLRLDIWASLQKHRATTHID